MERGEATHYNIFKLAQKLEMEGKEVIHFEVGDPYIDIDEEINDELCRRAKMGYTHYSSPYGIDEFRVAVSDYLKNTLGIDINTDNILVTPGSKSGLEMFIEVVSKEVEDVVILYPTWGTYEWLLKYHGIRFKAIRTQYKNYWRPSEDDLTQIENIDFQMMILLNPSNPTGLKLDNDLMDKLVDIAMYKDAIIVSDEVYYQTIYDENYIEKYPSILKYEYEYGVALHSLSKSHAMTGYRLGWITAKKEWIDKMVKIIQHSYTNIPVFIQYAGIKAIKNLEIPKRLRTIYRDRTLYMAEKLEKLGFRFHRPDATFYIFAKVPDYITDTSEFIIRLLTDELVALAPGNSFGGYDRFIRFSAVYPKDKIDVGIARLANFLMKWTK